MFLGVPGLSYKPLVSLTDAAGYGMRWILLAVCGVLGIACARAPIRNTARPASRLDGEVQLFNNGFLNRSLSWIESVTLRYQMNMGHTKLNNNQTRPVSSTVITMLWTSPVRNISS